MEYARIYWVNHRFDTQTQAVTNEDPLDPKFYKGCNH